MLVNDRRQQLLSAATAFRRAIDKADRSKWEPGFREFPRGACGPVCELLGRYLEEEYDLKPLYVCGSKYKPERWTHAWLLCDGFIVDITADQFGEAPVVVTANSEWHGGWKIDDEPRQVVTPIRGSWQFYPALAWATIKEALAAAAG
jgi:hypothetical protein